MMQMTNYYSNDRRNIKIRVPVESFPNVEDVKMILTKSIDRLQQFSGCMLQIEDKQGVDTPMQIQRGHHVGDTLHLLVAYTYLSQLEKLEELISMLAKDEWSRHNRIVSRATQYDAMNARDSKDRLRDTHHVGGSPNNASEGHVLRVDMSQSNNRKGVMFMENERSSLYTLRAADASTTIGEESSSPSIIDIDVLYEFYKMIAATGGVLGIELKRRYTEFYKKPLELTAFSELSKGIAFALASYTDLFEFDISTELVTTKLSKHITFEAFKSSVQCLFNKNSKLDEGSVASDVSSNEMTDGVVQMNQSGLAFEPPNPPATSSFSPTTTTPLTASPVMHKTFRIPSNNNNHNNNNSTILDGPSLFIQLLHRTLVKSGQPITFRSLNRLFKEYWGDQIFVEDLKEPNLKQFIAKHPNVFMLLDKPKKVDGNILVLPMYQPNFEQALRNSYMNDAPNNTYSSNR